MSDFNDGSVGFNIGNIVDLTYLAPNNSVKLHPKKYHKFDCFQYIHKVKLFT